MKLANNRLFSFIVLFFLAVTVYSQATITIEVNWPNWSSENRVRFLNPSGTQIGASICNPGTCYVGGSNNAYNNLASPATFTGVAYGNGYSIMLEDTYGDGWQGVASYVRIYVDGNLIVDTDLTGGSSRRQYFNIMAPPSSDTDMDGIDDTVDVDDDNDGILDTEECGGSTVGTAMTATNISHFTNVANAEGVPGSTYAENPLTYPGSSSVLLLRYPVAIPVGTKVSVFLGADPSVVNTDIQMQRSNAAGANMGFILNASNTPSGTVTEYTFTVSGTPLEYLRVEAFQGAARVYGSTYGVPVPCSPIDTDSDGLYNYLDLDSDGDGIPDNVEAQTTLGYISPANLDSDTDGLDDSYESNGFVPIDTDGDGTPDFMDLNSDNIGGNDTTEAGLTLSGSDSDNDGLDNSMDLTTGYADPGGSIDHPLNNNGGSIILPDFDSDASSTGDVDYRDSVDDVYNEPASVSATGNQMYCSGDSIPVVETISITDPDDTSTSGVYIQISGGYENGAGIEDVLTLTGTHPNITTSWDPLQGKLSLIGPATYTEFEAAVLAVEYTSNAVAPSGIRQFSITLGAANFLPSTGHYYEYVDALAITWTDANTLASARKYNGLQGYLATLTSQDEADFSGLQAVGVGWIGGSDAAAEGVWEWVTGPEAGTVFWNGLANGSTPNFAFWNAGEPNNSGDEDYAHIAHPNVNPNGSWNDLTNTGATSGDYQPQGYVVEYGGMPGDPPLDISAVTTVLNMQANPVITEQPVDATIFAGKSTTFSVSSSDTFSYQWQQFNGTTWVNISETGIHSGTNLDTLTITNASISDNGNQYRVLVNGCIVLTSNATLLTIKAARVITNRGITHRVI